MRISTSQMHLSGIQSILDQQSKLTQEQVRIASGKRISKPSDDPIAASHIVSLNEQIGNSERFIQNAGLAENKLNLADNVLESISNVVQRIRELQIQGANDSIGSIGRDAVQNEMRERMDELLGLVNTQDSDGNFMFSGFQTKAKPFVKNASGEYIYNGDAGQRFSEVSEGLKIPVTDSGFDLFENIPLGNGTFHVTDPGATNTGTGVVGHTSIYDSSQWVADDYTVTFVTNSAGDLAYQVVGATTGQLIPALPAAVPADAPAYVDGQAIQFNGAEIEVSGTPAAGDDYLVQPSSGKNALNQVQAMIDTFSMPDFTPEQVAQMRTGINQGIEAIDQILNRVLEGRTAIGARLNTIESSIEVNNDFILHSKETLSGIVDLDYSEAVSKYESMSIALQAAQQTYLRIRNLNLFSFMN